jgi:branched-chain amino acid transport system permease protein
MGGTADVTPPDSADLPARARFGAPVPAAPTVPARASFLALLRQRPLYAFLLVCCVIEAALPFAIDDDWTVRIILFANIFVIYAASYDLLGGYAGLISFGHSLFFGGAGYVSGLISLHTAWPLLLCLALAWVAAPLMAFGVGYLCLRLKGPYLAVVTLVFPLVVINILHLSPRVLGGDDGIAGFALLVDGSLRAQFYLVLAVTALSLAVILALAQGSFGLRLKTIREDELGAEAAGIHTTKYKILAFVVSGGFAGLAGTLYAHIMGSVAPTTLSPHYSILPVIMMSLGGAGSVIGAIIGAYVITLSDLYLLAWPYVRVIVYAAIIISVLRFFPGGLMAVPAKIREMRA